MSKDQFRVIRGGKDTEKLLQALRVIERQANMAAFLLLKQENKEVKKSIKSCLEIIDETSKEAHQLLDNRIW